MLIKPSALEAKLIQRISQKGPLSIKEYMEACLYDASLGFYKKVKHLTDHFVTAPEISQLFSEMIAIYVILQWEKWGKPKCINLVELGPGHGTLAEALTRLLNLYFGPDVQLSYLLVENSPTLKAIQQERLKKAPCPCLWVDFEQGMNLGHAGGGLVILANEFFDALPIHQYIKAQDQWQERYVDVEEGSLVFRSKKKLSFTPEEFPKTGDFYETSPEAQKWIQTILSHMTQEKSSALLIDYGYDHGLQEGGYKDTLQAVFEHRKVNPLTLCGQADLTAHVDFGTLKKQALLHGFSCQLLTQRDFLLFHGIMLRLERLLAGKDIAVRMDLIEGAERLVSPEQMGLLFKVLQIEH